MDNKQHNPFLLPLRYWLIILLFSLLWHLLIFYVSSFIDAGPSQLKEPKKPYQVSLIPGEQPGKTQSGQTNEKIFQDIEKMLNEQLKQQSQQQTQQTQQQPEENQNQQQQETPTEKPAATQKPTSTKEETLAENSKEPAEKSQTPVVGVGSSQPKEKTRKKLLNLITGGGKAVYQLRSSQGRRKAIKKYGGSQASENSVELGLQWLIRHQDREGHWDGETFQKHCHNKDACWGRGRERFNDALTALSLMAFLGAGYSPNAGPYQRELAKAQKYLIAQQDAEGYWQEKNMYNQGIVLMALAELFSLTKDPTLKKPIQRAVDAINRAQQPGGGWTYEADSASNRNDSSITGWQVLALVSAKRAGFAVSSKVLNRAWQHFQRMTDRDGQVRYASSGPRQYRESHSLIAVNLLCSELLREYLPVKQKQVKLLVGNPPKWERRMGLNNCMYYWYHGTLALFVVGGKAWQEWNAVTRDMLIERQIKQGEARGSWEPDSKWGNNAGGRIYSTAICVLMLEVYYRYDFSFLRGS